MHVDRTLKQVSMPPYRRTVHGVLHCVLECKTEVQIAVCVVCDLFSGICVQTFFFMDILSLLRRCLLSEDRKPDGMMPSNLLTQFEL